MGRPRKSIAEILPSSLKDHPGRYRARVESAKLAKAATGLFGGLPGASPQPVPAPKITLSLALRRGTREWVQDIASRYDLQPQHLKLLLAAAESWDRYAQARAILNREGLTFLNRWSEPMPRPEIAIEQASRLAFFKALEQLDLPGDAGSPDGGN